MAWVEKGNIKGPPGDSAPGTDLSIGAVTPALVRIDSSTGSSATLLPASTTMAGIMSRSDKVKLDAAEPGITAGTTAEYWRGDKSWQTLDKAAVGLGNVDNTSDANKPISSPQQAALDAKQDSGFLTGTATSIRVHNGNGDASGGALRINGTPTLSYHINDVRVFGVNGNGHFFPDPDNTRSLGLSTFRWSVVYAATGSINTSDAREKTPVADLTPNELAAAAELSRAIGTYQWLSSIAEKGVEAARHHAGLTVQRAIEIMQWHGLDPFRYGFICYDQWDEEPELKDDETGEVTQEYRPAGDRYSFRHDELLLFLARGFAARLDALENSN